MVRPGNDFIDYSPFISDTEMALHDYADSPRLGLEKLQSTLYAFQSVTPISTSSGAFQSSLQIIIRAVDQLLLSGSPYLPRYHTAFMSAADALFQVAIGYLFGHDRFLQLSPLLSIERSCWSILFSLVNEKKSTPVYIDYKASLTANVLALQVGEYLAALGAVGSVTFHLGASGGKHLSGHFVVSSVQSVEWLKLRFPDLKWEFVVESNTHEAARALCEKSLLPIFQHTSMLRNVRQRLLEDFECQIIRLFYKEFRAFFALDVTNVKQGSRLVPVLGDLSEIESINEGEARHSCLYFPIRHGGFFSAAKVDMNGASSKLVHSRRLGQDCLSSFLYEVETHNGRFVFDQAECCGFFTIHKEDIFRDSGMAYFGFKDGLQAEIILTSSAYDSIEILLSSLPEQMLDLLVVEQAGMYFALPYLVIRELECICSRMSDLSLWVKNIWLDRDNKPYLEPWLVDSNRLLGFDFSGEPSKTDRIYKKGYYSGSAFGKVFWIEADLILTIESYLLPFTFNYLSGDLSDAFVIYDGRCFNRVITEEGVNGHPCLEKEKPTFSAILEWMGKSVVLPLDSCEWNASLPETGYIEKSSTASALNSEGQFIRPSLLSDIVVIDKTNFLSFVDGLWPSTLSVESDY